MDVYVCNIGFNTARLLYRVAVHHTTMPRAQLASAMLRASRPVLPRHVHANHAWLSTVPRNPPTTTPTPTPTTPTTTPTTTQQRRPGPWPRPAPVTRPAVFAYTRSVTALDIPLDPTVEPKLATHRIVKAPTLGELVRLLGAAPRFVDFNAIQLAATVKTVGSLAGRDNRARMQSRSSGGGGDGGGGGGDSGLPEGAPDMFKLLSATCVERIQDFNHRGLIALVFGVAGSRFLANAELAPAAQALYSAAVDRLVEVGVAQLGSKDLAVLSMAVANIEHEFKLSKRPRVEPLFKLVADAASERPLAFTGTQDFDSVALFPNDVGLIVRSLAQMHVANKGLIDRVVEHWSQPGGLSDFAPEHVTRVVHAMATTRGERDAKRMQGAVEALADLDLASISVANLAVLVDDFALMRVLSRPVVDKIIAEVMRRDWEPILPRPFALLARASSALGADNTVLLRRIAEHLRNRPLTDFTSNALSSLVWAFACAGELDDANVRALLNREEAAKVEFNRASVHEAHQLHDVIAAWRIEVGSELPPLLRRAEEGGWIAGLVEQTKKGGAASSLSHRLIAHDLELLGCTCENEWQAPHGLSVDILVQRPDGRRLALEIDGPFHYHADGVTLNGSTRFKHRLLKRLFGVNGFKTAFIYDLARKPVAERLEAVKQILDEA